MSGKEKPRLLHVAIGVLVILLSYFLLFNYVHKLLFEAVVQFLSLGQFSLMKTSTPEGPVLILNLPSGTRFSVAMTWQRSGLLSIIVFSLLFVFLTFPLRGALWCKILWLFFGCFVGLAWNFIRWSFMVLATYHLGVSAFNLIDFLTGPVLDFLWVVPVWSVGLSMLVSTEKRSKRVG